MGDKEEINIEKLNKRWFKATKEAIYYTESIIGNKYNSTYRSEKILDDYIPAKHEKKITYVNTLKLFILKSIRNVKAIVMLCESNLSQEAFCLLRVNIEMYYWVKYFTMPLRNEDKYNRTWSFVHKDSKIKLEAAGRIKKELGTEIFTPEDITLLEEHQEEYCNNIESERPIKDFADTIGELESYRNEYMICSLFLHTKPNCFTHYVDVGIDVCDTLFVMKSSMMYFRRILICCKNEQERLTELKKFRKKDIDNIFEENDLSYIDVPFVF